MEADFQKATSQNLPSIHMFDVYNFFMAQDAYVSAEFRMKKLEKSSRPEYGDDAVGYVQVKNGPGGSTVRGKIIPEHRVSKASYPVQVELDVDGGIKKAECEGCKAHQGGCKHVVAFLFWLQRRGCEKSTTEVTCYWTRPKLAEVPTMKPLKVKSMLRARQAPRGGVFGPRPSFLHAILSEVNGPRSVLTDMQATDRGLMRLSIWDLLEGFVPGSDPVAFIAGRVVESDIDDVEVTTREQADSPLWHHLRAGRLTASRIYDVSRCQQSSGTLLETIMGAKSFTGTEMMERGKRLERDVIRIVEGRLGVKVRKAGLTIDRQNPVLAASPDGLCELDGETTVVEVKCPSAKRFGAYLNENGSTSKKVRAQLLLQMKVMGVQRGLLCVADPAFQNNHEIHVVHVPYNAPFIDDVISQAMTFWNSRVLPLIIASEQGPVPPAGRPVAAAGAVSAPGRSVAVAAAGTVSARGRPVAVSARGRPVAAAGAVAARGRPVAASAAGRPVAAASAASVAGRSVVAAGAASAAGRPVAAAGAVSAAGRPVAAASAASVAGRSVVAAGAASAAGRPVATAGAVSAAGRPVAAAGAASVAGRSVVAAGAASAAGRPVAAAGAVSAAGRPVATAGAVSAAGRPVAAAGAASAAGRPVAAASAVSVAGRSVVAAGAASAAGRPVAAAGAASVAGRSVVAAGAASVAGRSVVAELGNPTRESPAVGSVRSPLTVGVPVIVRNGNKVRVLKFVLNANPSVSD